MEKRIESMDEIEKQIDFSAISEELKSKKILENIVLQIYNGWPGKTWIERVQEKLNFIGSVIGEYASMYDSSEHKALINLCDAASCNYTNWFQPANIPKIRDVHKFRNLEHFKEIHPEGLYICPKCWWESIHPSKCSCEGCDWKVYGFLGDLWKWIYIYFSDEKYDCKIPQNIFKPKNLI